MRPPALLLLAMPVCLLQAPHASAQDPTSPWPTKPVRIVIPVPPGGVQDLIARAIGQELSRAWGHTVLADNRPGAGGVTAADIVAKASADGCTILMSDEVPLTITPLLHKKLPYDAQRDFTPVIALVQTSHVMVVASSSPANTLQALIDLARSKPGAINYGSFGPGSTSHLNMEEFAVRAGISLRHVPYKGGAAVLRAIVMDEVQVAIAGLTPSRPLLAQGRIKALAYTGGKRAPTLPEVPTVAEAGVPGFETHSTFSWVVPAGTPRKVIAKIAADAGRVITMPEFHDKYLLKAGLEVANVGPDRYPRMLQQTREKYATQVRKLQFKAQ